MSRFETFVSFSLGFEMSVLTNSLLEVLEGILYPYNLEIKRKHKKRKCQKGKSMCQIYKMNVGFFWFIRFCKEFFAVAVVSFGDVTIPKPGP